jgi:membrane protein implicated in regulation of membrane protease activity
VSKSYKLKRAYTLLKALAAIGIGGMTFNGFILLSSGHTDVQTVVSTIVGFLAVMYFGASYSKADMEKDDLMEKTLQTVQDVKRTVAKNKAWGKVNKMKSEANELRLDKLEGKTKDE